MPTVTPQGKFWLVTDFKVHHGVNYDLVQPAFWTSKDIVWSKGQLEKCETTDRLHWQFCVCFNKKKRLAGVQTVLGNVHAELTRSDAAHDYVWKDETSQGRRWEFGRLPTRRNSKPDWEQVWQNAVDGSLTNVEAQIRVVHYNNLRRIRMDHMAPVGLEKQTVVYWGPTGLGKSRRAWAEAGWSAYPKAPTTKFWDGYQNQEHVVMDEFFGQIEVRL